MNRTLRIVAALALLTTTPVSRADEKADEVERRVESILAQMTLDEKINYIGGYQDFNVMPIPRLGLPELIMSDGPAGVRNFGPTNAYPAPVCLAASWDTDLARRFGESIGRDARARGVHIWLGPGMNLTRQPQGGRNFEYFGEDPFLTSRNAVNVINGVQSKGVVATAKHFVANDQEFDRNTVSSEVDERTLRELYMRPFEASVRESGVWAVMTSYNLVNGRHSSEQDWMLRSVLKGEWKFRGVVMSDWTSVYSTAGPVKAGLDLEMPSGLYMNREKIKPLLKDGAVSEAMIDDKVRRILRMAVSMGFLDRAQKDSSIPLDDPFGAETALRIAREGIVLLKNDGVLPLKREVLPLRRNTQQTILVVGPNADGSVTGGGGSSFTQPHSSVSVVDALRAGAGEGVQISHWPIGISLDRRAVKWTGYLRPEPDSGAGLKAEFFNSMDLSGPPVASRIDEKIDFDWDGKGPVDGLGKEDFSIRWTGRLNLERSGEYTFVARSDDGMRAYIDGTPVIDMWKDQAATRQIAKLRLSAGTNHQLRVEYYQHRGGAIAQFGLVPPDDEGDRDIPAKVLAHTEAVIACVGFDQQSESEGFDRPFELPEEQEQMLRKLVASHSHVIVVLNAGASVDARSWADKAGAVVMAWYPGQSGNSALAEILFGVTNPSGKLPITFERSFKDSYANKDYPPVKDGKLHYDEGLFMGYRYFDKEKLNPLFCFGQGLSYTTFEYRHIKLTPGGPNGSVATVSAQVKNTGTRSGDEVVQLYVGARESKVPRAVRELKGFTRVSLAPGEEREVRFEISRDATAYYDVKSHAWVVEPGRYDVFVGPSSRDLPLKAEFRIEH